MLQQQGPIGGSNGVPVTTANSAATGDAFAAVTSTSATFIFDTSTTAYSGESFQLATAATSVVCNATWTYTAVATVQERIYFKATDFTSTQNAGLRLRAGATQACRVVTDSSGHIRVLNTTSSLVASSTGSVALSTGTWYRLEVTCTQGSAGSVSWAVYDLATETLVDSLSSIVGNYGTANISESGFGFFTATANINPWWFASIATSDAGTFPIGKGGAAVTLTDAETLTDSLGIATGSTPVALSDSSTMTASLGIVMSLPAALSGTQTLTDTLGVSTSTPSVGVPFRQDIFGASAYVAVEAAWGADLTANPATWTWYDITADVMYNPGITVNPGRGDETSQSTTTSCPVALDNRSGSYSDFVTTGIYGSGVRKGTPLRVRQNLGAGFVVLFQGRIWDLTPTWDTSGKLPIVKVQASGRLRQQGQPKSAAQSPMRRAMNQLPNVLAYWPMEEGSSATQCLPAVGNRALTVVAGTPAFGADGGLGSVASVDFTSGLVMRGPVPLAASPTSWRVSFAWKFTGGTLGFGLDVEPLYWTCADGSAFQVQFVDGGGTFVLNLAYFTPGTGANFVQAFTCPWASSDASWHTFQICAVQNGADIDIAVAYDDATWHPSTPTAVFTSTTLAAVTAVYPGFIGAIPPDNHAFSVSHIAVMSPSVLNPSITSPDLADAVLGYLGETADVRIARVAAEEDIPCAVTGSSNVTLGVQPTDSPLNIWRDAEKADLGVLYDGFSDGIGYICRSARYNQTAALTIDGGANSQLAPPFAPANDDQRLLNQFTASGAGYAATVADTTSPLSTTAVGLAAQGDSYNTADATYLSGIAGQRINQGTVNSLRYPNMGLNFLNKASTLAATWLALAASTLPIGFRVDLLNIATSARNHPPGTVTQIVEGYTLKITNLEWSIAANCSAYAPNRGWTILSGTQGRISPSATTLNTPMSTTSTGTITILTPLQWSTLAADYTGGASIQIDGEQITVTGAGTWSAGSQTLTVSARSQNGVISTHLAGAAITLYNPGKVLL